MHTKMQNRNSLISRVKDRIPLYKEDFNKDVRRHGFFKAIFLFLKRIFSFFRNRVNPAAVRDFQYNKWMENVESKYLNKESMKRDLEDVGEDVKFSIVFPVWNVKEEFLRKALDSITSQVYENWEICISDGSSKNIKETEKFLKSFQEQYPEKVKLSKIPITQLILLQGITLYLWIVMMNCLRIVCLS